MARHSLTQFELECKLVDEDADPIALPFPLLEKITDDFSSKLEIGRGGFAVVYKTTLDNGAVAVKRLSNTYMYEKEFHREVECLMKVKHRNIVRFLGYCADTQGNIGSYNGKMVMADVQQRLLCFEYLPKGSLDKYIKDTSGELEWRKCYQVIKGICEGLNYLHQKSILHLDLKSGNILLDEDMTPKITDFGLSRCFEEDQTRFITKNVGGTLGYLAPEYLSGEITHKFDLYSLGVIIIEILTRKKGYQTIENVLEIWRNAMLDPLQWEQIRVCAMIGIECTEADPAKRPASMTHIIDRLAETECSTHVIPAGGAIDLLLLHSSMLCFPFEPNKVITCPLQLTNNTNKHVAFRLMEKSIGPSFLNLPLYGLVPPNTPYTLIVTTQEKKEVPRKYIIDVILDSATLVLGDDEHINTFQGQPDKFFQEMGNAVYELKLKALYNLPGHITTSSFKPISRTVKVHILHIAKQLCCLDTNHANQWIIIGEDNGHIGFWDYQTQASLEKWMRLKSPRAVACFLTSLSTSLTTFSKLTSPSIAVTCVKFIERRQWIVAGTEDGYLHVYSYVTAMQRITSLRVGSFQNLMSLAAHPTQLAVHPTQPYLLSAYGFEMKLWDWDKGWECIRTFEDKKCRIIYQAALNTKDTVATASMDCTVEIWNHDSPEVIYSLVEHSGKVNCLDFFTCDDQEYLVTGSHDQTAKIWDLQQKICVYTLEAFASPVTSLLYQPKLQILITGSEEGAIYLWSTTNCRTHSCPPMLKRIIKIGFVGAVYHLACVTGRVVVGNEKTAAIVDIDNVNNQEQSTEYSEQQLKEDMRQHAVDTSSKEIASSNGKLLDVLPVELLFPYHPNEPISCSLLLTNNTNENVAFRLVDKSGKSPWCFAKLPLYGIVPCRSTYTLIVTTKEEMKIKDKKDFDLVIESSSLGDKYIMVFQDQSESDQFFVEAKEFGNMVHETKLKAVYEDNGKITSEIILVKYNPDTLCSLDAHPTEPWILTGHHSGYAHAWNHEIKYPMNSFKVSDDAVSIVKFIARRHWIIAVTSDDYLHVYDCVFVTKIKKIRCVEHSDVTMMPMLAIHPILPYAVTSHAVLLDWQMDWKRTQSFDATTMEAAAFNPEDPNSFASGSWDGEVKVWRLGSSAPEYSLPGHFDSVNCLDFITHECQQYLITGSEDCTAKIWDLKKRECICTLEATSPVLCMLVHPNIPVLITGTAHGIIHVWSSTDFMLKRTINLGGGGPVVGLGCLTGAARIVIGQDNAISTIDLYGGFVARVAASTMSERPQVSMAGRGNWKPPPPRHPPAAARPEAREQRATADERAWRGGHPGRGGNSDGRARDPGYSGDQLQPGWGGGRGYVGPPGSFVEGAYRPRGWSRAHLGGHGAGGQGYGGDQSQPGRGSDRGYVGPPGSFVEGASEPLQDRPRRRFRVHHGGHGGGGRAAFAGHKLPSRNPPPRGDPPSPAADATATVVQATPVMVPSVTDGERDPIPALPGAALAAVSTLAAVLIRTTGAATMQDFSK